jgi:CRISPR-associated exonuclease Cas4
MEEDERIPWRVTDLKQYVYCPRILYYHACLPRVRPVTFKMEASGEAHAAEEGREQRRSLKAYGLQRGDRHFHVCLVSERLGMRGEVDMVIETGDSQEREAIPVDYKQSTRAGEHYQLQLTAYAVMLEDAWGLPVKRGFIYYLPLRQAQEVRITGQKRAQLDQTLSVMGAIVLKEEMPPATRHGARCVACEFRRFCNDVF